MMTHILFEATPVLGPLRADVDGNGPAILGQTGFQTTDQQKKGR